MFSKTNNVATVIIFAILRSTSYIRKKSKNDDRTEREKKSSTQREVVDE